MMVRVDHPAHRAEPGRGAPAPEQRITFRDIVLRQGWISGGILILMTVYTLYFAKALLLPIFLAFLLSILLRPIVRALRRMRVPDWLGGAIVLILILTFAGTAVVQVAAPAGDWIGRGPFLRAELESKISALRQPFAQAQQVAEEIEEAATVGEPVKSAVVVEGPSLTQRIYAEAQTASVSVLVVLVLVYFLLARGHSTSERVLATLRDPERQAIWTGVLEDIQDNVARYLLTLAAINVVLGALTAFAMWALGMPNPLLWGVLAGLLNFLPYAGALVTLGVIGIVSILTFDQWLAIALPPGAFLLLTALEGQIVNPMIVGRQLTLDPVVVFASILFWGWLWGLAGMLLAVPILASIKITLNALQPLNLFGALVGDEQIDQELNHGCE